MVATFHDSVRDVKAKVGKVDFAHAMCAQSLRNRTGLSPASKKADMPGISSAPVRFCQQIPKVQVLHFTE
jgi:hypothetical protein